MQMEDIFTDLGKLCGVLSNNYDTFTILHIYLQEKDKNSKTDYKNMNVSLTDKQAKLPSINKELLYPFYIILVGV